MRKLLLILVISAFAVTAFAQSGVTIRVVGSNHFWTDNMEALIPAFEKETGIKVNLEKYGEDQLTQKLTTEFTAGRSNIDVFMTRPLQEARVMEKNGWYEDLSPYIEKNKYDFDDYTPSSKSSITINGTVTAIPLVTESEVLYYRKDLLEAKGIKPPTTMEELYAAAEKLTDRRNDMYGFVARGQRSPLITQFSSFMFSYGGDFFNQETRKATVNSPETLAAIEMYGTLLNKFGPDGVLNMAWPQAVAIYNQGKVALYTDASSIYANMLDPTKSSVADRTGVMPFPAGPAGSRMYNITAWALAINKTSPQKEAAWKFVEYMTSKESCTFLQGERSVQGARISVWEDPEGVKSFPKDWTTAVIASANGVPYDRPLVVAVGEARDIIGDAVVAAIEGKDFKRAADTANRRFQAILDREK